ncbi:hypothetical protein BHE16_06780 [Neomicrococcus aestuarii]|uniref:Uncharacterized protein n=1 Tax=Neomicrococcus aestuarii TaxID=556325 RepID=A0A1L2ZP17_9MICC|nr:hypothetical protein BHE16_06780 [Neomicrococcus aestuarii]
MRAGTEVAHPGSGIEPFKSSEQGAFGYFKAGGCVKAAHRGVEDVLGINSRAMKTTLFEFFPGKDGTLKLTRELSASGHTSIIDGNFRKRPLSTGPQTLATASSCRFNAVEEPNTALTWQLGREMGRRESGASVNVATRRWNGATRVRSQR